MGKPSTLKQRKVMLVFWWVAFALEAATAAVHTYKYLHQGSVDRYQVVASYVISALLLANAVIRQQNLRRARQDQTVARPSLI